MYVFYDKRWKQKIISIWQFGKKVSNITKKKDFNNELIYNKKYLKSWKRILHKRKLHCFNIPVILFDSVYRNDGNYYPKVFLEKFIHTSLWRSVIDFGFWGYGSSSWNIRKVRSLKYKEFFRGFRFRKFKSSFLLRKYQKFFSVFSFLET